MAKKGTAHVISLLLVAQCMFMVTLYVDVAQANPIAVPIVPDIDISYPVTSTGGYVNSTVEFEVYVNMFIESTKPSNVSYSLDGAPFVYIVDFEVTSYYDYGPDKIDFKTYKANIVFKDLSEGNHTIVANSDSMSASRSFTVNSHYQVAVLKVLSPTGVAYAETVPLIFSVNGEILNAHYYLYKSHESVFDKSLSGNTTLDNLSAGSYDMYLFVTTEYGQSSTSIPFSVADNSLVGNLPFIVFGATLLSFSTAIGLLVYLNNRKRL